MTAIPLLPYIGTKFNTLLLNISAIINWNWFVTLGLSIVAFFQPIYIMWLLLFMSVGIDCISGIVAARKRKERISSFRLKDTIIKLFLYVSLVAIIYGIEVVCLWGLPLSNIVAAFILFAEAVSVAENIDVITNGKLGIASFVKNLRKKWLNKTDNDTNKK